MKLNVMSLGRPRIVDGLKRWGHENAVGYLFDRKGERMVLGEKG